MTIQHTTLTAAAPLVGRIGAIDQRLAALRAELGQLNSRHLLPKAEVTARLLEWLRSTRTRFESSPSSLNGVEVAADVVAGFSRDEPSPPTVQSERHAFELLVWLLWPALEASAPEAVQRLTYDEGLSLKARTKARARLTDERAALVAEREELVDRVTSMTAGALKVDHLEETAQRRSSEARNERALQARREAWDAVEHPPAMPGTNGL